MEKITIQLPAEEAVAHLQPDVWATVNRLHVQKMLSEFAHELLITPQLIRSEGNAGLYSLTTTDQTIEYRFLARILGLDHWQIDATSITKSIRHQDAPLDSVRLIIEFKDQLGFSPEVLPAYLEEIISCLYSSAYMHTYNRLPVKELIRADYQDIEHAMMAGHPCFVANNGRIGFDAVDYQNYAPEAAHPLSLVWLAGHHDCTEFTGITDLTYQHVLEKELEPEMRHAFDQLLLEKELDPAQYIYFPVHPWQWYNKLVHLFAPDIAANQLVCLGATPDQYLPQQSVRTFFNVSHPEKYYVKSALSILNMGFMRGLSPYFMRTTPAINEWVYAIVANDPYLQQQNFIILREVATVGYTHSYFEEAFKTDTPYKKLLASLWRESPMDHLEPGQQLMTMAALLHVDAHGNALLPELIRASGVDTTTWLQHYLQCYLSPLLHCFYYHDMRFMPHGENVILVLEDHVPVRAIMKDIGEEVAVVSPHTVLPDAVERIRIPVPEELKILSIFTQAFDCYFRFLNAILVEHQGYPEEQFWELVADCIAAYQRDYPELEEKFRKYDLFAPEIIKTCLNRLQIRNNKKMVDASDPFKSQLFAGTLKNPLFSHRTTLI